MTSVECRQQWPRLSSLPLTNAIGVAVLVAWSITGAVALVAAVTCSPVAVPAAWWDALKWFAGYAFAQFAAKRASHQGLWKRDDTTAKPITDAAE